MATAERAQETRRGWFSTLFGLPFQIMAVLVVSLLMSVLVEWAGIHWQWWSQPGAQHALETLETEVARLDTHFTRSLLVSDPVALATRAVTSAHEWLFVRSGIAAWLETSAHHGGWLGTLHIYVQAALYVTLMTLTRVVILLLTSPLFALAALVGFVDGLVRRDLRRFGAGRESAFIYHHAKRAITPVFVVGWLFYLSVPFAIHPNAFLLPCAALFGLLVSIATGSFKKYL
ncbi:MULTISPECIES: TIGR03747 family integrating conjugative element membrane protein [unclassified Halomonas]|uniref:TIGR03747 family integrating conjugative element membrane protein n=1 Tax=unclassified Halomonas TaxID=2609666 RepID=UPI0028856CB8|nr:MULTISPECIES: TIGR03747 family integrating conjugative element membrane protein [unclassified Halomonas]MDT0501283.1 TIGR03747 family integrating conjugative element membrane protein [Halomonas sp. PAR7]MDT0512193.1 TIGR03747 family integrating conjugative element membrane protein [Halomonas sp. LES1]MDT0590670.1 TIGR03747 family integrating conjugative element membrane protein [Halomonas sp. PAR8]